VRYIWLLPADGLTGFKVLFSVKTLEAEWAQAVRAAENIAFSFLDHQDYKKTTKWKQGCQASPGFS
jgi:hypothetical protein